jgi:hypothetical protein
VYDRKAYDRAWRARNKERLRVYARHWKAANKPRLAAYHRKHKYGLTDVEFQEKLSAQGTRCAICGASDPGHKNGWQVDHNHDTGVVRGILCCPCNIAIGFVEDAARVVILRGYLEAYS